MNNRGQFSIIAAMFVAVILISSVMMTYSAIRYSSTQEEPQILSAIDETNLALKQVLGFTVGYYGSVLQVTGNSSYARTLATKYLESGLANIADVRPEWGASFMVIDLALNNNWFMNASYSSGNLTVTYSLSGLGVSGVTYSASCRLDVNIFQSPSGNQVCLNVTKDDGEPLNDLGKQNFKFYRYRYTNLTWEMVNPTDDPIAFTNSTYLVDVPSQVSSSAYVIQVEDTRGIMVVASSFSHYVSSLMFNSTFADDNNYVDNCISNVDSSPSKGTHSNFAAQQQAPDAVNDTLTEGNVGTVYPAQQNYYNPDSYSSIDSTTLVSGVPGNLGADDGSYMTFRSASTGTTAQSLYVHQETVNVGGTSYKSLLYGSADTSGTTLSAAMSSSRVLLGQSVYSLQGVSSIPSSTWTMNYRAWKDSSASGVPTNSPSSTSGAWTNPTNAYADGGGTASSTANGDRQVYGGYGFSLPGGATVTQVRVRLDAYCSGGDTNDHILLEVSDGSWTSQTQELTLGTSESTQWVDITSWSASGWTSTEIGNIQTRVSHVRIGTSTDTVYLDYLQVEVIYTSASVNTNEPSSTSPTFGNWTNPSYAYSDDSYYAYTSTNGRQQTYYGYGFSVPSGATITQVRVRLDAWCPFGDDDLRLHVSNNGGSSWLATTYLYDLPTSDQNNFYVDITSWASWTTTMVNSIYTKVTYVQVGGTANSERLDYIPIEVTYVAPTTVTNNPSSNFGGWSNPTYAYGDDANFASSTMAEDRETYGGYGFSIPLGASITHVRVRLDAWCSSDDDILVEVSVDGGITWLATTATQSVATSQTTYWIDITSWTSWSIAKLNNDNIKVRVTHVAVSSADQVNLDWISIEVHYSADTTAHADADVVVRQSDGTIRTTIATNVASSANLPTSQQTLSGTYAYPGYTVVDQTDYLEIDYYVDVSNPCILNAYLRIDDNTLSNSSQTSITNMMLPNVQTCTVELYGPSNLDTWNNLVWNISSLASVNGVNVMYQLYSYRIQQYPSSGDGYMTAALGTSKVKNESTITVNATDYRDTIGRWSLKITAVKATSSPFNVSIDFVKFRPGSAAYALDLEEQWVNVTVSHQPALCIKTGPQGAENLAVDVWNQSSLGHWEWDTVFSALSSNSWNNVSVASSMSSPNFTIRFRSNDTGDTVQSNWQIDAALIRSQSDQSLFLSLNDAVAEVELLQNGTMRWLGQNLELTTQAIPIPPVPIKAIHMNQTIDGVNQEVPFQVEDWSSEYTVPMGLTNNATVFSNRQMIVSLVSTHVSQFTLWWNGSDDAVQTPLAYTNRYFNNDNTDSGILNNGKLNMQFGSNFVVTSTVVGGTGVSSAATFMRINTNASSYGAGLAYVIHHGVIRDVVRQEAEWSNGATNCPNVYANIVLTLPANATYYTYHLRFTFINSQQNRTLTDLCPLSLTSSVGQSETENGTILNDPLVTNGTGTFPNNDSPPDWTPHHWSQLINGTRGAGIMFTDDANQKLYRFDSMAGAVTGALKADNSTKRIDLLPVTLSSVQFKTALDITWNGAVVTFDGGNPIYNAAAGGTGLWILAELPPTITVNTGN